MRHEVFENRVGIGMDEMADQSGGDAKDDLNNEKKGQCQAQVAEDGATSGSNVSGQNAEGCAAPSRAQDDETYDEPLGGDGDEVAHQAVVALVQLVAAAGVEAEGDHAGEQHEDSDGVPCGGDGGRLRLGAWCGDERRG